MKRLLFLSLIILAACSSAAETQTPVSFFNQTAVPASLTVNSTSEQIQTAMLHNAIQWKTLHMDGQVTWFEGGTPVYAVHEEVWLDPLNSRYKVQWLGILNSPENSIKLSDGLTTHFINLNSGQDQTSPYPDSARVGQYVPPVVEGQTYPNLIWAQIGTPISQLAFPSDYSQNDGIFKALGMETIAGREALTVE